MQNKPRISAVKIPLSGWKAQVYIEAYNNWFDVTGCPIFANPDHAIFWAMADLNIKD
ncbi:MAG: hypothetical protein KGZ81_13850 [Flavobacteriales bacterium]|nr:hypothetical protein [Flavobacteriales bacterium]